MTRRQRSLPFKYRVRTHEHGVWLSSFGAIESKVTSSPRSVFQKRIAALNLRGVISRKEYDIENHQYVLDRIFFDRK